MAKALKKLRKLMTAKAARPQTIREKMIDERFVKHNDRTDREAEKKRKLRDREAGIERLGKQRAEEKLRENKPARHLPQTTQKNDKTQSIAAGRKRKSEAAFDKPYPFEWDESTPNRQQAFFQTEDGSTVRVVFDHHFKTLGRNAWHMGFERRALTKTKARDDLTGEGDAFQVFATVAAVVREFMTKQRPAILEFAAKTSEPSRVKVYRRMHRLLLKAFAGYEGEILQGTVKNAQGEEKPATMYQLKRVKAQPQKVAASDDETLYYMLPSGAYSTDPDHRVKGRKRSELPKGAKIVKANGGWSYDVTHRVPATFPRGGLYKESAWTIYSEMRKPEVSPNGLGSAIQMNTFFMNRAGKNLPESQRRNISRANEFLRTELRWQKLEAKLADQAGVQREYASKMAVLDNEVRMNGLNDLDYLLELYKQGSEDVQIAAKKMLKIHRRNLERVGVQRSAVEAVFKRHGYRLKR